MKAGLKALMQKAKQEKTESKTESKKTESKKSTAKTETKTEVVPSISKPNKNQLTICDHTHANKLMTITLPKGFISKKGTDHPDANTQTSTLGGSIKSLAQLIRFLRTKDTRIKFVKALDKKVATSLFELMYSEYTKGTFNHINFNDYIAAWNAVYPKSEAAKVDKLESTEKPKAASKKPKANKPKAESKKKDYSFEEYKAYMEWKRSMES